jgi:hypothetical protein
VPGRPRHVRCVLGELDRYGTREPDIDRG